MLKSVQRVILHGVKIGHKVPSKYTVKICFGVLAFEMMLFFCCCENMPFLLAPFIKVLLLWGIQIIFAAARNPNNLQHELKIAPVCK